MTVLYQIIEAAEGIGVLVLMWALVERFNFYRAFDASYQVPDARPPRPWLATAALFIPGVAFALLNGQPAWFNAAMTLHGYRLVEFLLALLGSGFLIYAIHFHASRRSVLSRRSRAHQLKNAA